MKFKILGDLHFHSLHSRCHLNHKAGFPIDYEKECGLGAIQEVIRISRIAKKIGLEYLAITNHTKDPLSTKPANNQEISQLLTHLGQIKKLNKEKECAIPIFAGTEADILNSRGSLSLPNIVLKKLDLIIASNHRWSENLSRANILNGYLGAIKNKHVDIIGHINRYVHQLKKEDWQEIIKSLEKHHKIIEFNIRAPLHDELIKIVRVSKILISLGSDIHPEIIRKSRLSLSQFMRQSLSKGYKAVNHLIIKGIKPNRIINTYSFKKIKRLFEI